MIIIKNKFQNEENTNSAPTRLIEKGRGGYVFNTIENEQIKKMANAYF